MCLKRPSGVGHAGAFSPIEALIDLEDDEPDRYATLPLPWMRSVAFYEFMIREILSIPRLLHGEWKGNRNVDLLNARKVMRSIKESPSMKEDS